MSFFDAGPDSIRPRLTPIETDEDILRDQAHFFSTLNNQPTSSPSSSSAPTVRTDVSIDTTDLNQDNGNDYNTETPTSVALAPICAKRVRPRRRKSTTSTAAAVKPSFPHVPHLPDDKPSVFARRASAAASVLNENGNGNGDTSAVTSRKSHLPMEEEASPCNDINANVKTSQMQIPCSQDAQGMLSAMSDHDIQATQAELLQKLDPDMVAFLQTKWRERGLGPFSNAGDDDVDTSSRSKSSSESNGSVPTETEAVPTRGSTLRPSPSSLTHQNGQAPPLSEPKPKRVSFSSDIPCSSSPSPLVPNTGLYADDTFPPPPFSQSVSLSVENQGDHTSDIRDSLFIPKAAPSSAKEADKLLWATDASVPVPSEHELDSILHLSVERLGPIASKRFDLSGNILSEEDIFSLPTHLGLHHHGSSPASAGYTISDILTLLRSSVPTQRVVAFQMLAALVRTHGPSVAHGLATSGALALAFAPFPSSMAVATAATSQLAYVDAVQAFLSLRHDENKNENENEQVLLLSDLFFASPFYSPAHPRTHRYDAVMDTLANTQCVHTLMRIAFENSISNSATRPDPRATSKEKIHANDNEVVALAALNAIRDLVVYSDRSCHALVNHRASLNMLTMLAVSAAKSELDLDDVKGKDSSDNRPAAVITLVSRDVFAQVFVRVSWGKSDMKKKSVGSAVKKIGQWLDGTFLRSISNSLSILLSDTHAHDHNDTSTCNNNRMSSPCSYSSPIADALGALRVFRAALAFQLGLLPFSAVVPAVCKLLYEERPEIVAESYLALESYVHCLHDCVALKVQNQQQQKGTTKRDNDKGQQTDDKHCSSNLKRSDVHDVDVDNLPSNAFIQDQLSHLVPAAFAAVKLFVGQGRAIHQVRAAAGHFAATLFVVYRIPFPNDLFTLILSESSQSSLSLISHLSSSSISPLHPTSPSNANRTQRFLRTLSHAASRCQAGARLLTRIQLEPSYAKREVTALLQAADRERDIIQRLGGVRWRPISNACAEWVGLYGRTKPGSDPISLGLQLLPFLSDTQVMLDLLSRSVLNADCLHALDKTSLSLDDARDIVHTLIPVTYDGICQCFSKQDAGDDEEGTTGEEQFEGQGLLAMNMNRDNGNVQPVIASFFDILDMWVEEQECWEPLILLLSAFLKNRLLSAVHCLHFLLCATPKFHEREDIWAKACDLLLLACKAATEQQGQPIMDTKDTILSSKSTTPNPMLADATLALADQLVSRGPQPDPDPVNSGEEKDGRCSSSALADSLSSVVLSLMLSQQVDISLRSALWEKTVVACGGALLYSHAEYIACTEVVEDEEAFLRVLVRAIEKCLMESKRCPAVVAKAVMERIEKAVLRDENGECVFLIRQLRTHADPSLSTRLQESFKFLLRFCKDRSSINRICFSKTYCTRRKERKNCGDRHHPLLNIDHYR